MLSTHQQSLWILIERLFFDVSVVFDDYEWNFQVQTPFFQIGNEISEN